MKRQTPGRHVLPPHGLRRYGPGAAIAVAVAASVVGAQAVADASAKGPHGRSSVAITAMERNARHQRPPAPSSSPSTRPTSTASSTPSSSPSTSTPTSNPGSTSAPTSSPSSTTPSTTPSSSPSGTPTPTTTPSSTPTTAPTTAPSSSPGSTTPSSSPSSSPTSSPSSTPSSPPSSTPTSAPSSPNVLNTPTWSDDFTGESVPLGTWTGCSANGPIQNSHCTGLPADVDAKWWAYPSGWQDTSKNGTYDPSKTLSIANGEMTMHLNRDSTGTYVAAPVPKLPGAVGSDGGQLYGTYSVTWKADQATAGFKTAWLLWPDSENWPGDGEIDFPEGSLNGTIAAFMHREGGTSGSDQDAYSTSVPTAGAWHTTIIDWEPGHLDFYLDGKLIGHSTSRIPNTPMHLVLQSETTSTAPAVGASADIHISQYSYWKPGAWTAS